MARSASSTAAVAVAVVVAGMIRLHPAAEAMAAGGTRPHPLPAVAGVELRRPHPEAAPEQGRVRVVPLPVPERLPGRPRRW